MARKALLVGINDYKGVNDLRGCINDVANVRKLLKLDMGFRNEDIRVLTDSRATKVNIEYRLRKMVESAKSGDILFFHFSGHGSQIRDRNNDELTDHMDELICPWDMDWDGTYITDDTLNEIFKGLAKGANLEVILDCCHSGTGTRDLTLGRPVELGPDNQSIPRYLKPPFDIECRSEGDEICRSNVCSFRQEERSKLNHVLWAGCRDNQTSADAYIDDSFNGAFTYHFCRHMRASSKTTSRDELLQAIQSSLSGMYSQIPQLECKAELKKMSPLQFRKEPTPIRLLFVTTPYLRGNDVKEIQNALKKHGIQIPVDGIYGPVTRWAVKKFQEKHKLTIDGIVGPQTRSKLLG